MTQSIAGELLGMVGNSAPIRPGFEQIRLVAPSRSAYGSSARAAPASNVWPAPLHPLSPRKEGHEGALNFLARGGME